MALPNGGKGPWLGDPGSIQQLVVALESRLEEIVDGMVEAQCAEIPSYRDASPEVLEEVRQTTTANIRACVAILQGRIDFDAVETAISERARQRAKQGFPLHEELLTYLLGARTFWEAIQEIAPEDPVAWSEVLPTATRLTLQMLQHATTSISIAYMDVEEARVADEEHDLQSLVETLAGVRPPDQLYESRATRRGIKLRTLHWCAVTHAEDGAAAGLVQSLRRSLDQAPVGRIDRCVVAYIPGEDPPEAVAEGPVGVARADDPQQGYRRAEAAFQVARHLGRNTVHYEEVMPLAMVLEGPPEDRASFVAMQLGPVLKDPIGEDLLRSLDAYYRSGQSVAAAARDLHVHRHTLEYRLDRVATLLDADLRDAGRRLFLELALALRE
ncbi:MAG: helix-turn-helix domain-containing protein [Actinomycetota bacterium]|nr:helix-turn-helix domain-containing protein [Actinomycetota bacterium]